jgi:creatinine amidohydrolase
MTVLFDALTREDVREIAGRAVAVIPAAAIEQHGPHLPLGVDRAIVEAIAERSARRATTEPAPIVVTPCVCTGISAHHFPFPGVLSVTPTLFLETLLSLGESLRRSGFRRVYLLNGHGGNDETIRLAAKEIAASQGIACGAASYWSLAWDELVSACTRHGIDRLPGHAGAFETSLMLAIRPELVRAASYPPPLAVTVAMIPPCVRPVLALPNRSDGTAGGYSDAPAKATREAGEEFLGIAVRAVSEALTGFAALEVSHA